MIYNLLILFLLIFCFPIPIIGNSVYLAILVALVKLLYQGRVSCIWTLIRRGYVGRIFIWTICLVIIGAIFTIINGAFEFSRTVALISLLIGLISVIIIFPSLNKENDTTIISSQYMEKLIVYVFIIQSIISILSFVSPSVKEMISHFQFKEDADLADESYSGFRGLALSGRLYFEFAASCGLVVIYQFKRILESKTIGFKELLLLLLLVICGFFAGRTSLVGFGVGFGLLLVMKRSVNFKISFILKFLFLLCLSFISLIIVLPSQISDFIFEHLLPWVFDVFIKLHETGSTEDSVSFNGLNQMYENVVITAQEWLVGSGIYTEPSGRYYGHVDAGYLRQILYWGIVGSIISFLYTINLFVKPWKLNRSKKGERLFLLTILIYTLIVQYKGDLLSISRFYYVILFLYCISVAGQKK